MRYFTKSYLSVIKAVTILLLTFPGVIKIAAAEKKCLKNQFPETASVTVTIHVSLSTGESPEGTLLTMTGVHNPSLYYEQTAPASGEVVFAGVTEANYHIHAALQGFYAFDTVMTITSNRQIPIILREITFKPRNLSVDSLNLRVSWQAPDPEEKSPERRLSAIIKPGDKNAVFRSVKSGTGSGHRALSGYGVFLDGLLVGNTTDTSLVFEPLVFGQSYLAGVAAVYSSGYSEQDTIRFTSKFLFPPRNTSGVIPEMTDYGHITWEAPEDPQHPGQPVPGISSYKLYRNQVFLADIPLDNPAYSDMELIPGTSVYEVRAVYELSAYGYPGEFQESAPGEAAELLWVCCLNLPFTENFETGLFETNNWSTEGNNNWRIAGQAGNQAPAAEFYFSPVVTDYALSLTSDYLIGTGINDGNIILEFDLKHTLLNLTGKEKLSVEVFDGYNWIKKQEFLNINSFNWKNYKVKLTKEVKGKIFRVRFTASGDLTSDISNWLIDNIKVYRECTPPQEFNAHPSFYEGISLEWRDPNYINPVSKWLAWDNGINADAIGLTGGGTFYVAARFTSSQLFEYEGCSLTRIRLFPYAPNGSITLKVWAGNNAGALLSSQVVTSYTTGMWNEFILQTPVYITGASALWVGYEINHTPDEYVAGCDTGPAIAGFGDMISLDGEVWEPMSIAYGLNYNWNIQGFVEQIDGSGSYIAADNKTSDSIKGIRYIENRSQREVLGYELYRDYVYIATTQDLSYFDHCSSGIGTTYWLDYKIRAIYNECESEFVYSSTWNICPGVGVSYKQITDLDIYPNPSADLIWIDTRDMSGSLLVYSFSGKLLLENLVANNDKPVISLKHYPDGAYLIKFVSDAGETYSGKLILEK
jgi:hypothetical protein